VSADRFGIGWRDELAAGIVANFDRIDVVEVVAESALAAGSRRLGALRTLARQVPVLVHGVGLGLASCSPVDERRLDAMARVVDAIGPEHWSEHLAFVRAGGIEIGHLAAPPRTLATVEGVARNVERARAVVGEAPWLENVATLIQPPASTLDEADWIARAIDAAGCGLLLDLHNLYANATNFGQTPSALLDAMPLERVRCVHLAGGRSFGPAGRQRLLDDHLHEVPDEVFDLLRQAGARMPEPVTVIIERDGRYPPMRELLVEIDRARVALARGRLLRRGAA
jgi:uncharacterized protein (UPF0276 family)